MAVIKIDNNTVLEEDILLEKEKKQFNTHRHSKEFIRERSMKNQISKSDEEPNFEFDTQDPQFNEEEVNNLLVDKLKDEKYWNDRVKQCETTFDIKELCREYMNVFFSQLNFCVEDAKEIATSWLAETQVFNYEKNPLMLWIQGMSDHNITISEDNCRAIQSLYANNVISAEHLKNAQHIANIMYNKTLYKYNKNDIEFIVKTFKFFDPANKILIDKHLFNEEYAKEQGILEYTDKKNNKAFSINYEKLRIFVLFDSPDLKNNNLNVIDSVKNLVINNTQKIKDILNLLEKDDSNLGLNLSERKYNKQGKLISTPSNNAQINTNLTNKVKSDYNDIINKLNIKWEEIPQFASYLMAQYANKS